MRVAIIGAGISGIAAGKMLSESGIESVIYEKNSIPGGLVRCDWVEGNLYHRVGGHIFNSRIPAVNEWFWKFFDKDKEFLMAKRNAGILMGDQVIGYPIENYLYQMAPDLHMKIMEEISALDRSGYRDPFTYSNFEDFLKGNFGNTLYELYFGPYNKKIWQAGLDEIPLHWLKGKLPMPDYKKILESNFQHQEETEMVHSTFYYPQRGGSQFIIDRLSSGLTVKINCTVEKLEYKNKKWFVNGEGPFAAIIYTADIRSFLKILESLIPEVQVSTPEISYFRSNGTSNIFCYTDHTDLTWLYIPGNKTRAHRIIYTGNLSPNNNKGGRNTCVVEFSGIIPEKTILGELSLLPGNLEPLAMNFEKNSYVIQDKQTRELVKNLKSQLKPYHCYLSGRFAEWEYYNMDTAIGAVLDNVMPEF